MAECAIVGRVSAGWMCCLLNEWPLSTCREALVSDFRAATALAVALGLLLGGCSSDSTGPRNPVPTLLTLAPSFFTVGAPDRTIRARGRGFVSESFVTVYGSERPTTVLNDSVLEFELQSDDVAGQGQLRIAVESPGPGGGTSVRRYLKVGFLTPGILSITPDTIVVHNTAPELVVIGAGFAPASKVALVSDVGPVTTTYVSDTELHVKLTPIVGSVASSYDVFVVQPDGTSTPTGRVLTVVNPVPVLDSVSVDSLLQFSTSRQVTAWGHDFVPSLKIVVNSIYRGVEYLDSTTVRFQIGYGELREPGQLNVHAYSYAPGGGTSDTVSIKVVRPAPFVNAMSPTTATVGAGDFLLTIDGLDFEPDAQVQIDGVDVATTFVSENQVTAVVAAASVAAEGSVSVRVLNPARGLASAPTVLPVLPVTPGIEAPVVVERENASIVGDPVRNVVYASIPAGAEADANSILKLDATTGAVLDAIAIEGDPGRMAVSENGQFLYAALRAAPHIVRIRLADFEVDATLATPRSPEFSDERALDLVVPTGDPLRLVATLRSPTAPDGARMVLYQDVTALPTQVIGDWKLARGSDETRVYGYASLSIRGFTIDSVGVRAVIGTPQFGFDFTGRLESSGGLLFVTAGGIFRESTLQQVGTIPASGPVCPDAALGRVHFRVDSEIRTYHATSRTFLGSAAIPGIEGLTTLVRVGTNGLALGGGARIVLVRGSLIGS